jgi:hypothetical protein
VFARLSVPIISLLLAEINYKSTKVLRPARFKNDSLGSLFAGHLDCSLFKMTLIGLQGFFSSRGGCGFKGDEGLCILEGRDTMQEVAESVDQLQVPALRRFWSVCENTMGNEDLRAYCVVAELFIRLTIMLNHEVWLVTNTRL